MFISLTYRASEDVEAGIRVLSVRETNSKDFFRVLKAIDAFSRAPQENAFGRIKQSGSISRLSESEGNKKMYGTLQLTPIKSLKLAVSYTHLTLPTTSTV